MLYNNKNTNFKQLYYLFEHDFIVLKILYEEEIFDEK